MQTALRLQLFALPPGPGIQSYSGGFLRMWALNAPFLAEDLASREVPAQLSSALSLIIGSHMGSSASRSLTASSDASPISRFASANPSSYPA